MKISVYKYLCALLFITIFSAGQAAYLHSCSGKQENQIAWQNPESENETSRNGHANDSEVKDFVAELTSIHPGLLYPVLQLSRNATGDCSFISILYLKVPTPPPNKV